MGKDRKKPPADQPVVEHEAPAAAAEEQVEPAAPETSPLQAALDEARAQAAEYLDGWQRSRAEFANYKRRNEATLDDQRCRSNEALLIKLLPVVDDFERALGAVPADLAASSWINGLSMILNKLQAFLESENVAVVPAEGQPFDPQWHEAMLREETTDHPDGSVLMVLRRGYRLGERMLRPALVKVASNPGGATGTPDGHNETES